MEYKYFFLVFSILLVSISILLIGNQYTGFTIFNSVEKYNFDNLPANFQVAKGQEFKIDLDYYEGYTFSTDNSNFNIDKESGIISFLPEKDTSVVIIALKDVNHFEYKLVNFEVIQ